MINKPSICWLCWKPMMMKWSKCTKYLSAQICLESHNFLKSDFFCWPRIGTDLKSEYLTSFTYLRYHFEIDFFCKMKLQCTAQILIGKTTSLMFFAFPQCILHTYHWRLCAWVHGTISRVLFEAIRHQLTWYRVTRRSYALFSRPPHPPLIQLACFLPSAFCTAGELIRWNQSSRIFGRLCSTLPAFGSKTRYSIKYLCFPLRDQNWDKVSICSEI